MSIFLAWTIIGIVLLLLLILLRKFIKRLIFIVILLAVAFFIYGLFSPSRAAVVWYHIKTFPQWIASSLGGELPLPPLEVQMPQVVQEQKVSPSQEKGQRFVVLPSFSLVGLSLLHTSLFPQVSPSEELPPVSVVTWEQETFSWGQQNSSWEQQNVTSVSTPTSSIPSIQNGLTAEEIRETEELFGLLIN